MGYAIEILIFPAEAVDRYYGKEGTDIWEDRKLDQTGIHYIGDVRYYTTYEAERITYGSPEDTTDADQATISLYLKIKSDPRIKVNYWDFG